MGFSKKTRQEVFEKFAGKCAYTGTDLKEDWQIDHVYPVWAGGPNTIDNLYPCQAIVNHYKRSLTLREFRELYLGGLHLRLAKLPKNPRSKDSIKRKKYILEVADLFGITADKPFSGVFYFETLNKEK